MREIRLMEEVRKKIHQYKLHNLIGVLDETDSSFIR